MIFRDQKRRRRPVRSGVLVSIRALDVSRAAEWLARPVPHHGAAYDPTSTETLSTSGDGLSEGVGGEVPDSPRRPLAESDCGMLSVKVEP